jgi:hypothetical protein
MRHPPTQRAFCDRVLLAPAHPVGDARSCLHYLQPSPRMKRSGLERVQGYRRFYLPFIYGLATANFIAVIQLISAPQLNIRWKDLISPETSEHLPFVGFCGMVIMAASVPILVGFALYTELALRLGHYNRRIPVRAVTGVSIVGMFGPGLTLFAFHPAVAIAYFISMIATLFVVDKATDRFKTYKKSNSVTVPK